MANDFHKETRIYKGATVLVYIFKALAFSLLVSTFFTTVGCGNVGAIKEALKCKNCKGTGYDIKENYWFPPKCKVCGGQGY